MQLQIQMHSGTDGAYLEPRSEDGRSVNHDFQIIWCPHVELGQFQVFRQTLPSVLGVARVGGKYGLRCKAEHAKQVHQAVRPGMVFLPSGKKLFWIAGPFPYGSLRSSITSALEAAGWLARPLQLIPTGSGVAGNMYKIQSVDPPPATVLRMTHGDIVVSKLADEVVQQPMGVPVVGALKTKDMVAKTPSVDFMQINDPWAKKQSLPAVGSAGGGSDPVNDLEEKITATVMKNLEEHRSMEVDGDDALQSRVSQLECKLEELAHQQEHTQEMVTQQAVETNLQMQGLHATFQKQHEQLEKAITLNGVTLQEQFQLQAKQHETTMQSMFATQMQQFDSLLQKSQQHPSRSSIASSPY